MTNIYKACLVLAGFLLLLNPAKAQTLSYSRNTAGFDVPTFEGGRTDFHFNDINDDGHVDIISIGDHGNPNIGSTQQGLLIWFNQGDGTFQNFMTGYFGYGGIVVGDVNNDGLKDIGFGMHHNYSTNSFGDQLIEVALGDGTGQNWTPWDTGLATNGESWAMFGTDFADVNNNGYLDLVSISMGSGAGMHVYLNQTDGSWVPSFGFLGNNSDDLVQFCDINNDGYMDIIAGHAQGTAYFGDGGGNFVKNETGLPVMGEFSPRYGIAVGDVNNNGGSGFAYINPSGGIEVFEWDNVFNTWTSLKGILPSTGNYTFAQLWDMNADGYMDVMAYGKRTFKLWLGDGAGNWTEDATFQTPNTPGNAKGFRVGGDLNKNGHGDIVLLTEEGPYWWNYNNYLYVYTENTVPDSLWIRPFYPKGNENFYPGSVRFIQWASAIPGAVASTVKIEISIFGNDGPWWLVAENLPNNGKYQWTVPNYGSDECFLKFTVSTGLEEASFVTEAPFVIIGEPTSAQQKPVGDVTVYPNPGLNLLIINTNQRVQQFRLINPGGTVILDLKKPSNKLDVSALPAGLFYYQILLENGDLKNGKWVKIRR